MAILDANFLSRNSQAEQILKQIKAEEGQVRRGRLKIFLGYAPGVGKTYKMFDEGFRRHERGEDVVICAIQKNYIPKIQELVEKLEIIPTESIDGKEALDLKTILKRHPQVALIDGLAHDNPDGAAHQKRWQDIAHLLRSGISVITSINVQYIEELQGEIKNLIGTRPSVSVPREFIDLTDEIVVVDALPTESETFAGRKSDGEPKIKPEKLGQLREMALVIAAEVVDRQFERYLQAHGLEVSGGAHERILVFIHGECDLTSMLESGRRNADRYHGVLFAAYRGLLPKEGFLKINIQIAKKLHAEIKHLAEGDDVAALLKCAGENRITQIFIDQQTAESNWRPFRGYVVDQLARKSKSMDISIYSV